MHPALLAGLLVVGIVLLMLIAAGCVPALLGGSNGHAARRAEALVRELLSSSEYAQLEREGYLEVASRVRPDRVYRIRAGNAPVVVVEHGRPIARLCLQPVRPIAAQEMVVVHKVLLEAAEEDYWRRANLVWPGALLPRPPRG